MVRLTKIYTRGGDQGKTSLTGGKRVDKHHQQVEAYGSVDEVNAHLSLIALYAPETMEITHHLQQDLFDLGADLSIPLPFSSALDAGCHYVQYALCNDLLLPAFNCNVALELHGCLRQDTCWSQM